MVLVVHREPQRDPHLIDHAGYVVGFGLMALLGSLAAKGLRHVYRARAGSRRDAVQHDRLRQHHLKQSGHPRFGGFGQFESLPVEEADRIAAAVFAHRLSAEAR